MARQAPAVCTAGLAILGKYQRMSPLVLSLLHRSQGLFGSQE